jgi:hypothetical protein
MNRMIFVLAIVMLALCGNALGQPSGVSSTVDPLVAKDAEIKMLRANLARQSEQIAKLKADLEALKKELTQIDVLKKRNEALEVELKEVEARNKPTPVVTAMDKKDDSANKKGIPEPWSGFRGIAWGASVVDVKDIRVGGIEKGERTYSREGEEMQIGVAKLNSVSYGFYDGQFWKVNITFDGFENYGALAEAVKERYGKGNAESTTKPALRMWNRWDTRYGNCVPEVTMELFFDCERERGWLIIIYKPMLVKIRADKDEEWKRAPKNF